MAAKKENVPNKPIVSRVPLPVSDSALVIDLPDGQKLVIGKMNQGTVIEVATWRGVGRPDSRTNRMMFGMSTADIEEDGESSAATAKEALQPENIFLRIINYPVVLIKWLFGIQSEAKVKKNGKVQKKLLIGTTTQETSTTAELTPATTSPQAGIKKKIVATASQVLAQAMSRIRKLKTAKPARSASTPTKTVDELEIDTWLASITSKSVKNSLSNAENTDSSVKKKK